MNSMSGKELAKLLECNDWILLRVQAGGLGGLNLRYLR
jgi:hypothetical protein